MVFLDEDAGAYFDREAGGVVFCYGAAADVGSFFEDGYVYGTGWGGVLVEMVGC